MKITKELIIHDSFEIGVLLKFLNGILELIGTLLVFIIPASAINNWVIFFDSHYPNSWIAGQIVDFLSHLSGQTWFAAIYLSSHGLLKIFLVICLWQKRLWAYPTAIAVFIGFGLYQMYRYNITHSLGMIILTLLDVIVIMLTYLEYKNLKARQGKGSVIR